MSGFGLALALIGVVVVRGALKGLNPVASFQDIFDRAQGGPGLPAVERISGGGERTGNETPSSSAFPPDVERWRSLVSTYFPPLYVNQALSVMECESRGNPNATNPLSSASGLFQHLPKYWADRSRKAGIPGANIYDPTANVRVAGWLFKQSNTWDHWSCKPSV